MTLNNEYFKNTYTPFKNIKCLDPEFLPTQFHYRDNEMATLASNISPIFYGSMPIHTVILGNHATGKTTAIKKLFNEIDEKLQEAVPVYVNCRKDYTEYQIYSQIYNKITDKQAPIRGSNSHKLLSDTLHYMKKYNKILILALDDANYLLGTGDEASPTSQNIIRQFTRANESYNVISGIYPIISTQEFKYKFELEVNTLFTPAEVHFHEYTREEYYNIIKERCDCAFNIELPSEVLDIVTDEVLKNHNIRYAWDILKMYGLKYEEKTEEMNLIQEIIQIHNPRRSGNSSQWP